ncbi:cysteine-rich receptor-like protein kinase 44 [Prosopis cineraria]|uniref:cysteine-rich receptor-like protein kinase 44 n=1 Tax=Prosopis cineraria TaxID=364024 RepID=UPI0024109EB3|nr:cysteine-rich receptor-like protein kinase 44 [Prosopis cineraria]
MLFVFKSSANGALIIFVSVLGLLCLSGEAVPVLVKNCTNENHFQYSSRFEANLDLLLSNLVSSASGGFSSSTKGNGSVSVSGFFFCRDGAIPAVCRECVATAAKEITRLCPNQTESTIWYDECLLRYSNQSISDRPLVSVWHNSMDSDEQALMDKVLPSMLDTLVATAISPNRNNFAVVNSPSSSENFSASVQCVADMSASQCSQCLQNAVVFLPTCCRGEKNASVMLQKCSVKYDLHGFDTPTTPILPPPSPSGNYRNGQFKVKKIIVIVVPIGFSGILLCLVCYFFRRRKRKNYKTVLRENFGIESSSLEYLQFDLATIEAATSNFSQKNRIGKGGFGEVYKGVLFDGREIAIKRLSRRSGQGALEFKNEILLIAKLQHRNLVTLLGFCLEEQEKILIYEYVPNKSLDYFLFGTQKKSVLDWLTRYKIIEGIAQEILYLHKYSRLKIIYRDLKPSNILLDYNMNPKISDFGMAKIVGIDEIQGSTNRVVGTFGYMPPEYIMFGQFSKKLDIFSFGVIVLEIISGKKNATSYEAQHVYGLLDYVSKQWKDENLLEIMDSSVAEVGSQSEVIRCIHIGLLCVQENPDERPPIATVVSYLNNDSIALPYPREPAFSMHGRMRNESGPSQHTSNSTLCSVNQMSVTNFFPR